MDLVFCIFWGIGFDRNGLSGMETYSAFVAGGKSLLADD
jgi:hypothetical protein